ncbi:MAG: hypothetical protein HAW63_03115 [Bdellovibrionaceae bacterium]|nr:hypothetical protein [Pseudobdellovibrionaceae bacterium]
MKVTGQILKEARLHYQYSLQDVSASTKIQIKYLEALEQGNIKTFNHSTVLKNFTTIYSDFLKLDSKKILAQLEKESPQLFQNTTPHTHSETQEIQKVFYKKNTHLIIIFVLLLFFALIWQLKILVKNYSNQSYQKPTRVVSYSLRHSFTL